MLVGTKNKRNVGSGHLRNRKARSGRALLLSGMALMLTGLAAAAASLPHLLVTLGVDAPGASLAATLAFLRFLRAMAFHPSALLPFIYGILLLFLAFTGILAGLILLRDSTVEKA